MSYFKLIRGDALAPLFDNRKQIAPLIAAAAPAVISAVGSLVGNSLNNKAIRANNQMQQNLIKEQNTYNAPEAQVARMRQAGLNPYMMLGQVNSGNQQSIAQTIPENNDTAVNGLTNAANQVIQSMIGQSQVQLNNETAKKTASETALNEIDARTRAAENNARINTLVKQGKLTEQQAEQIRQQNDLTLLNWDALAKQYSIQNQNIQADTDLKTSTKKKTDNESDSVYFHLQQDKKWSDQERYAALRLAKSNSLLNDSSAMLNSRQGNVLKHEGNSAYWRSRDSRTSYLENRRHYNYNRSYFRSPINDRNWGRVPLLGNAASSGVNVWKVIK